MTLALYLAAAAGLLFAIDRWWRPVSMRTAIVLLLLAGVDGGAALVDGTVRAPIDLPWATPPLRPQAEEADVHRVSPALLWDVHTQMIPWAEVVSRAWRAGEWPLWNPHLRAGEPLLGSGQPAPFHPLHLILLLLPMPAALNLIAAGKIFVAALGMFLAARELDLGEDAALVAGVGWAFCGYLHAFLDWPNALVAAGLPWVLAAAARLTRRPGARATLLLALGLAWILLAGHPEPALYALTSAGLFFLVRLAGAERSVRRRALFGGAAAALVALALSAVALLPLAETVLGSAEYSRRAARSARSDAYDGSGSAALSLARASVVPFAEGVQAHGVKLPAAGFASTVATPYPGVVLWAGLVAAILVRRDRRVAGLLLALAAAFAVTTNLFGAGRALRQLPWFEVSLLRDARIPAAACLVLLGAVGVDRLLASRRSRALGATVAVTAAMIGGAALLWKDAILGRGVPVEWFAPLLAWQVAPALVAGLALLAPRGHRWAPALLVGALLVERAAMTADFAARFPERFYFPRTATIENLPDRAAPYRVVAEGNVLLPNYAAVWNLEDVRGYNAVTLRRYERLSALWSNAGSNLRSARLDSPMKARILGLLNVRFALAGGCGSQRPGWELVGCADNLSLLENRSFLPRAWIPSWLRTGGDEATRLGWLRTTQRLARDAWLETATTGRESEPPGRRRNGAGEVELLQAGSGYRLRTRCRSPCWVVISTAAWPGWRAESDTGPLEIGVADLALLAVRAPSGESDVRLSYRPAAFDLGLWISAVTASLLLAGIAAWIWTHRRRSSRARQPALESAAAASD